MPPASAWRLLLAAAAACWVCIHPATPHRSTTPLLALYQLIFTAPYTKPAPTAENRST